MSLATLAARLHATASPAARARATQAARDYLNEIARKAVAGHVVTGRLVAETKVEGVDDVLVLETADRTEGKGAPYAYAKQVARQADGTSIGYGFAKADRARAVELFVESLTGSLRGGS